MRRLFVWAIITCLFFSCKQGENDIVTYISLDESNLVTLDLENEDWVILDSPRPIGRLFLAVFEDNYFLLRSQEELYLYTCDGQFVAKVSKEGRGNSEYMGIPDFGFIDNKVYLYDTRGNKVMFFDIFGRFLNYSTTIKDGNNDITFQSIIKLGDEYIGKRMFRGVPGDPELAIFDRDFCYIKNINASSMRLRSGRYFGEQFAAYTSRSVLYNRSFDNKIYEVTRDTAKVRYSIDFDTETIDINKFYDESDIIKAINAKGGAYSTLIQDMEYKDGLLSFNYSYTKDKNGCRVAVYDSATERAWHYRISSDEYVKDAYAHNGQIYVFTAGDENKTKLYRFPISRM